MTNILEIIGCITIGIIIGFFVGGLSAIDSFHQEAVSHNAAYYNPTNKQFTWQSIEPPIN